MLHSLKPAPQRRLHHHGRDVGRDHVRPALREHLGDVSRPGCEIEDGVAGSRSESGNERLRDGSAERRDGLSLRLPTHGGRIPAAPQLVLTLYAATPLNCGRMSRPYVASVSSWPCVIR